MSQFEQIFFESPGSLDAVGQLVADATRLRASVQPREVTLWGDRQLSGLLSEVGGTVEPNVYAEHDPRKPSDMSIFDDMPFVFEFRVLKQDFHLQADAALTLYRRLVDTLHWRSALTSEYATLVASYDDVHGYREFPPDTLSDGTHADRWR